MADDAPWLTIIGLGEDGPSGLSPASLMALEEAEIVMGPPRHLSLLPNLRAETLDWPVPFADGLEQLETLRGRKVVVLASGDPFWFGAGSVMARRFDSNEWRALPGLSCFSLAAARLGWPLERAVCLGLHAAPFGRLRPHLAPKERVIVTLRDGAAVAELAQYLQGMGFGESGLTICQALGGPREQMTSCTADTLPETEFSHPICVAIEVAGAGAVLPLASGLPDDAFDHDGQITKRPMRALTLSALAPRPGELLWDIGGGSGSIAIEWLLRHPSLRAISVEPRAERAARIRANALSFGVERLEVVTGTAPDVLADLPMPDVVFVGGGLSDELLQDLTTRLSPGTRLVANAVTLESEALLTTWRARIGGDLLRIEMAQAQPLGRKRGWKSAYPVVQWSVTL